MEHVITWEEAHGQSIPQGWVVHHLNGIKDDNRPENLVALPSREHRYILAAKAQRIQDLEKLITPKTIAKVGEASAK